MHIRPITAADASQVASIIRSVGAEYGAVGEGFGPGDAEVEAMDRHYGQDGLSQYWVCVLNGQLAGGAGIAPLAGSEATCELKKLFLLPPFRGQGIGRALCLTALQFAKAQGYQHCYLDTLRSMGAAIALYESLGFRHLNSPLAASEHSGCDVWMIKQLV